MLSKKHVTNTELDLEAISHGDFRDVPEGTHVWLIYNEHMQMCTKNGKMYSCQEKENKNRCLIESAAWINSRFKHTCFTPINPN